MKKYELSLKKKILEIIDFKLKQGVSNYDIAVYLDDIIYNTSENCSNGYYTFLVDLQDKYIKLYENNK